MYEKWKVIAIRKVSFTDEKTKELVSGVSLFLARPSKEAGWQGVEVAKFWLKEDSEVLKTYTPSINQDIEIAFNRYGKISFIKTC